MKKELLRVMQNEIIELGAIEIGYNYAIIDVFDPWDVIDAMTELSEWCSLHDMPEYRRHCLIVTKVIENMTLDEFEKVARYFLSYKGYLRQEQNHAA